MKNIQSRLFFGAVTFSALVGCGGTGGSPTSASESEPTAATNEALATSELDTIRAEHKACLDKDADKATCEDDEKTGLKAFAAKHEHHCDHHLEAPKPVARPGGGRLPLPPAVELDGGAHHDGGPFHAEAVTDDLPGAFDFTDAGDHERGDGGGPRIAPNPSDAGENPCAPKKKEAPTAAFDKCVEALDDCLKADKDDDTCALDAIECLAKAGRLHVGVEPIVAPKAAGPGVGDAKGGGAKGGKPELDGGK